VMVVAGEAALLVSLLYSAVARNSLFYDQGALELAADPAGFLIVGLLLIGFGIKVGIVPLHVWLPLAHPAAPVPASAVLSGAIIKAGLLGWLRFLPLGEVSLPDWGNLWMSVGIFTTFYGVVVGVQQRESKTVLAYSSISQMGLLTMGVGGGLLLHTAWPMILSAVLVFALHHGFSKGCLFLSVAVAPLAQGRSLSKRLMQAGLLIPALVLAGAPLTMGAISKSVLKDSLAALPDHWTTMLDGLLPLTSIGTTLLMARFLYLLWPRIEEQPASPLGDKQLDLSSPQRSFSIMLWAWGTSLVLVLAAPWLIPSGLFSHTSLSLIQGTIVWSNLWPIGAGSCIAWLAWRFSQLERSKILPTIPAGDIIEFWQPIRRITLALLAPISVRLKMIALSIRLLLRLVSDKKKQIYRALENGESALAGWQAVYVSMMIVSGVFVLLWIFNSLAMIGG